MQRVSAANNVRKDIAMKKLVRLGVIVGVVGAVLLTGTVAVLAQGPSRFNGFSLGMMGRMSGLAGRHAGVSEAVAKALGMTVDELQTQLRAGAVLADLAEEKSVALQELRDLAEGDAKATVLDRIAETLADGNITEAYADWFKRGVAADYVFGFDGKRIDNPVVIAVAEALDMKVEEVELQMWAGRTLDDLAERAGVDLDAVETAVEAARKSAATERIQQAVEDGKLTEEQAEWMLEGVENGFGGGRGVAPMMRGARDRMPMRGFGDGTCPTIEPASTTDA
jgi:hypothetical protein